MSLDQLRDLLGNTPPAPILDIEPLRHLLAACWNEFRGSGDQAMEAYKLDRIEQMSWNPPLLTFVVERHGGTVLGSSRAELQRWTVDLDAMTAECEQVGHRQIAPMLPRLDVRPLADEIARLILSKCDDARLKWYPDGRVRVLIGTIIPTGSAVRRTLEGRRRRFRKVLAELLENRGWREVKANLYERVAAERAR